MNQSQTQLENIEIRDGRRVVPERRLPNAKDGAALVTNLIQSNRERARFKARVKGCIDGSPPYSASKLRKTAQSWRSNVNFMEMDAARSTAMVPFYDLFSSSRYYAEVVTEFGESKTKRDLWSRIITEEFDLLLKSWPGFDFHMQSLLQDFVTWGKGVLIWPDKDNWRFKYLSESQILVPDKTSCLVDEWEVVVIRNAMLTHKLWSKIRNKDAATSAGWKVDAVARAIASANPQDTQESAETVTYELIQQKMKDRDISEGASSNVVLVADILVREFDGSITHTIISETFNTSNKPDAPRQEWLYEKKQAFKSFREFLCTFVYETLDGSWNGTMGFGRKTFSTFEIKNRLRNSVIDNGFLRGAIVLQAKDEGSVQNTELTQIGPMAILPPGYEVQQAGIFGDIAAQLDVNRDLDMMITSNTGIYRARMEKDTGNPRTAREVSLQYAQNATLSNSSVNRFYSQYDRCLEEVFSRASKSMAGKGDDEWVTSARRFRDKCLERGVPAEALSKIRSVRAFRAVGNGSVGTRQEAIGRTAQIMPMFPDNGRRQWLMEATSAMAGQAAAERWVPDDSLESAPDHQAQTATLENSVMAMGGAAQWAGTDDDMIHLNLHMPAAANSAGSVQQGGDPLKVLMALKQFGPHIAQHLQSLSKDPSRKDAVKVFEQQLQKLGEITDKLQEAAEQKMAEEQEQQQDMAQGSQELDAKTRLKAAETQAKIAQSQQKTNAMLSMKEQKHRQDLALKDARTAEDIRRSRTKANLTAAPQ